MFCGRCGANVPDNTNFCPSCGAPLAQQTPPQQEPMPEYGYQPPQQAGYFSAPQVPVLPMKWFKFLIYFSLFAGAVLNVISAVQLFTGSLYTYNGENISELVYVVFDGIEQVDMITAIAMLALAALLIVTRFRLAGYYQNGPKLLNLCYLLSIILGVVYVVTVFIIVTGVSPEAATDGTFDFSSQIGNVIGSLIVIFANRTYFRKRAHLFTR